MDITYVNSLIEIVGRKNYKNFIIKTNYIDKVFSGLSDDYEAVIFPEKFIRRGSLIKIACGPIETLENKVDYEVYLISENNNVIFAVLMEKSQIKKIYKIKNQNKIVEIKINH